jgi:hypothetical protein
LHTAEIFVRNKSTNSEFQSAHCTNKLPPAGWIMLPAGMLQPVNHIKQRLYESWKKKLT